MTLQVETLGTTGPIAPDVDALDSNIPAGTNFESRLQQLLALGAPSQANAVTIIYGDSGTGKTSQCVTAAIYTWKRFGKITRYIAADIGGFGNKMLRLIRLGIVQAYNPLNHIEPFETMELLAKGYWPREILDPYTGFAAPDVELVAPTTTRYDVFCKEAHLVQSFKTKTKASEISLQCPECKGSPVTMANWGGVEEVTVRAPGEDRIGLRVVDSGTAVSDWSMETMSDDAAKRDPGIKDGNALSGTGARIVSGTVSLGANTQQHYGFAQNTVRRWMGKMRSIPGQIMPPIWTFLELRATDDSKNIAIYGPKIAGNAKTAEVTSWGGNCLYAVKEKNAAGKEVHRLWLVNHSDSGSNIPHLAKTRAEPGTLPDYLEDKPDEAPFTTCSLVYFFDRLETALESAAKEDAELYPDAPLFQPPQNADPAGTVISRNMLSGAALTPRTAGRPVLRAAGAQAARPAIAPIAGGLKPIVAPTGIQAAPPALVPPVVAAPAPLKAAAPALIAGAPRVATAAAPAPPSSASTVKPASAPVPVIAPAVAASTPTAPAAQAAQQTTQAAPVRPSRPAAVAPPGGRPQPATERPGGGTTNKP